MTDRDAGPLGDARDRGREAARRIDDRLPRRLRSLLRRLADRDLLLTGSSLAFYGLVSALPLLMLAFGVAEAVGGEGTLRTFTDRAGASGPDGSAEFLEQLVRNGGSLTFATVAFTLWPATAYGGGLRRALVRSSDHERRAPGLQGRLLALAGVLVLPALVLAGAPLVFVLSTLSGEGWWATVLGWALAVTVPLLLGTALIAVIYRVFSPDPLDWPDALRGAGLTAALSAVFSIAFVVYLGVADTEERFGGGTIAVVVLLGLWLFVANVLLLAGYHAAVELDDEAG